MQPTLDLEIILAKSYVIKNPRRRMALIDHTPCLRLDRKHSLQSPNEGAGGAKGGGVHFRALDIIKIGKYVHTPLPTYLISNSTKKVGDA